MVLMQSGLRNPDNTNTNSEHVCNIDSHFKDNINLPIFHHCVFMIKTPLEETSYETPPSKSKIPSFTPFFFMVLMQSGLRNPDSTNTNSEHVCNIDSHFKDNINLPSFHPCVFMIKTPLEETSYRTPSSKSKIPSFRPFFFMVLMQSG